VVDDEPEVLDTLREILEELGYKASVAASGEQAIAAMATVQPHVVFLDMMMPGVSHGCPAGLARAGHATGGAQ